VHGIRVAAPEVARPWLRVDGLPDTSSVGLAAPDAELDTAYTDGQSRIYLHIGYYETNRRGAQAVSSAHEFDVANRWTSAASGMTTAIIDDETVAVQYRRMVKGQAGHVVWYWYWVDGRLTGNAYVAKLLEAKAKLIGGDRRAAIIVAATDYVDTPATAEQALRRFLADIHGLSALLSASAAP
jgi:EpsI family protein